MILTCDNRKGGGYIFTLSLSGGDERHVRFPIEDAEDAETMSAVLRRLAEHAQVLENAWRNAGPFKLEPS